MKILYLVALFLAAPWPMVEEAGDSIGVVIREESEGTGTMHYARSIKMAMWKTEPLVIETDVARGVLAPEAIFLREVISENLGLVIGYSSSGGGEETWQAFLLGREGRKTVLLDHCFLTAARGASGFIWSKGEGLLVLKPKVVSGDGEFLKCAGWSVKGAEAGGLKWKDYVNGGDDSLMQSGAVKGKQTARVVTLIGIKGNRFVREGK